MLKASTAMALLLTQDNINLTAEKLNLVSIKANFQSATFSERAEF